MDFPKALESARDLAEIFELVKRGVLEAQGTHRAGLMLALADLGNHPQGFVGAFFPVASNVIVMNKTPLLRIRETNPELYKPYAFHVLMHEYLHSLGYLDERLARQKTYDVTRALFGEDHVATRIAADVRPFFPHLVYPDMAWTPERLQMEFVKDFDSSSVHYIR